MTNDAKAYYDILSPKYITWEFYANYIAKESPFGEIGAIVFLRTYSRFIEQLNRREYWRETILRTIEYSLSLDNVSSDEEKRIEGEKLFDMMFNLRGFPAGRSLWIAGTKVTDISGDANYNCSAATIDSITKFAEGFFMLLNGAGFGLSVQERYTKHLPVFFPNKTLVNKEYEYNRYSKLEDTFIEFLNDTKYLNTTTYDQKSLHIEKDEDYLTIPDSCNNVLITVGDSRIGWVNTLRLFLTLLTKEQIKSIEIDYDYVRPEGSILKTFGGRSSGHKALQNLLNVTSDIVNELDSPSQLSSVQCLDIMNAVGLAVVVGGTRRCLPKGSLVHTNKGLIPIEDIKINDLVKSGNEYFSVLGHWSTGEKETLKINTMLGSLICSPEHRVAVLKSLDGDIAWKEAQDLIESDRLVFNYGETSGIKTSLPKETFLKREADQTSKTFTIPELDEDIAWLIGYLHGNGCVKVFDRSIYDSSSYVSFACPDNLPECHNKVVRILRDRFNVKVNENNNLKEKCSKPKVTSVRFAEYISKFKQSNTSIIIPDFILQGLVEIRAAYLAGLFDSDGHCSAKVTKKSMPITLISSIYPTFVEQLSVLVSSLGIASKIGGGRKYKSRPDHWNLLYHLNLVGQRDIELFDKLVGHNSIKFSARKQFINPRVKSLYGFSATPEIVKNSSCRNKFSSSYSSKVDLGWQKIENTLGNTIFAGIPIKSIEEYKLLETYDIEVENSKSFVVGNGYLVHNSSELVLGDISDTEFIEAKNNLWSDERKKNKRSIRVMSNNSVTLYENPGLDYFKQLVESIKVSGEPGVYSIGNAQKRTGHNDRILCNPCLTGDMKLLTFKGERTFKELAEEEHVAVINKDGFCTLGKVWKSGIKKVSIYTQKTVIENSCENYFFPLVK